MPIHSIDYLNARKDAVRNGRIVAKGNADRLVNPVDVRARDADMDAGELLHEKVRLVFADFRAWFAASTNDLHAPLDTMEDGYVPF